MRWLLVLVASCTPVSWVDVSVEPNVFDRGHAAWYVEIYQRGSQLYVYNGYVCDRPLTFTIHELCPDEAQLTGHVWRMPDRAQCGQPRPLFLGGLEARRAGGVRIATLRPRTVFHGHREDDCDVAAPEQVTLWPPAKPGQHWRQGTYWIDARDVDYQLESSSDQLNQ